MDPVGSLLAERDGKLFDGSAGGCAGFCGVRDLGL
jgi:hypothetical protein